MSFVCFRQTQPAIVLHRFHTYSDCSVYVVRIFFCIHVKGLEQGYSISFIWGPDNQTENGKGRPKGVGAVPVLISFWGTYKIWK